MEGWLMEIGGAGGAAVIALIGGILKYAKAQLNRKDKTIEELREKHDETIAENTELAVAKARAEEQLLLRSRGKGSKK
jgi:hypothetical protein